jgi:outer membrane lipopolysaccharide assembly protein LptE/RlpB
VQTRKLLFWAWGAVALLSGGCGYHLVGTSSYLPESLQTLHVRPFENRSNWAAIDQRVGEALAEELVRRRRFELVEDEKAADAILEGTISAVSIIPVSFDADGRATEYQMTLSVAARLQDVTGDEPETLWEDQRFSRRTSYEVQDSAEDYFDRQIEAMEELSREFSRGLITAVLEGF